MLVIRSAVLERVDFPPYGYVVRRTGLRTSLARAVCSLLHRDAARETAERDQRGA
jgi:hypothetical protein